LKFDEKMDAKRHDVEEKPTAVTHLEDKTELGSDKLAVAQNADYTGAEAKTDPAEIALVKKIDWRLMVRMHPPTALYCNLIVEAGKIPWSLANVYAADIMCHVLPQLRRPKRDCAGEVEQSGR
jgi:hypothetical protein